MKFLIDAHLPYSLKKIFMDQGFDCIHTLDLPFKNLTSDNAIQFVSMNEKRIVVTKDADFFHSYLLKREPYKLVFVTVGNLRLKELIELFQNNFSSIITSLENHGMVELNRDDIKILF